MFCTLLQENPVSLQFNAAQNLDGFDAVRTHPSDCFEDRSPTSGFGLFC